MVKVEVDVSKESYELMAGVAGFVGVVMQCLKDGWQPGQDLPAMLAGAMANLIPAVAGVEKLPAEAMEETPEFVAAILLGGVSVYKAVRGNL